MAQKERVLLVHNHYKIPGGEDTAAENERRLLEEHGHSVFLYTRSNQEMESFSAVQKLLLPFTSIFSLRTYREVKKIISEKKIDIIHVHNTLNLITPSVYYAAFACRKPVVQTIHNFRLLCPGATFLRKGKVCEDCVEKGLGCAVRHGCYRNSRAQTLMSVIILKIHRMLGTYRRLFYICLTDFNREKLLLINNKGKEQIRKERIFVKPNFVQLPPAEPVSGKEQYLYIGRLEELKGIRILLEAWKEFPEKKLLLCGSGPMEAWVRAYVKKHHMDQVLLLGQCEREKVLKLLAESKGLIVPSICYEGQPMVILESYAAGTPVIASDLGNAGNMVEPGRTGVKFACGDAESLREAVMELEEQKTWDTRAVYEEKYTAEKNYIRLREIYAEIRTVHSVTSNLRTVSQRQRV